MCRAFVVSILVLVPVLAPIQAEARPTQLRVEEGRLEAFMLIESKKLHLSARCRKIIDGKKCLALDAAAKLTPAPDSAERFCTQAGGHVFQGSVLMPEGKPMPICRFADASAITLESLAERAVYLAKKPKKKR